MHTPNLAEHIIKFATQTPEQLAIVDPQGNALSYSELAKTTGNLATHLPRDKRLALLADKTLSAYIAMLAASWNAIAYVPLSLKAPAKRLCDQLEVAECGAAFIDENGLDILTEELIRALPSLVFASNADVQSKLTGLGIKAEFINVNHGTSNTKPTSLTGNEEAYIIFTSGSSGTPKGVVIPTKAREGYGLAVLERHPMYPNDRVAQTADLSWDLSVGNLLMAFVNGGTLYLMSNKDVYAALQFIQKNSISVWRSVPTIAEILYDREELEPNSLPSVRWTGFAGSALLPSVANAWHSAAPNTIIANEYGPTEMTVDCIDYTVPKNFTNDTIPIGTPFIRTEALVVKENNEIADVNEVGELFLTGPTQAIGYLKDEERTSESFVWRNDSHGNKKRWYRTRDLVLRDASGLFHFKGRADHQLKVMGYRVELGEIEVALRKVTNIEQVVVMGDPIDQAAVDDLVAFIAAPTNITEKLNAKGIREALVKILPPYMIPRHFFALEAFPRIANGKLDRKALPQYMKRAYQI